MNCDEAFLSSSSSSVQGRVNNVRKRGSMSLASSQTLYSQHTDDAHQCMDFSEGNEQGSKRARYREPLSPGIASLPTADLVEEMEMTIESERTATPQKTAATAGKVEWWKQQSRLKPKDPPRVETRNNISQSCIVCRLPCQSDDSVTTTARASSSATATMDIVPSSSSSTASHQHQTTLLQYFTPKYLGKLLTDDDGFVVERKMSKMVLSLPPVEPNTNTNHSNHNHGYNVDLCTFCEKAVCVNCQATCEECHQLFCWFCSTKDYTTNVERVVCLDCRDRTKQSAQSHMLID